MSAPLVPFLSLFPWQESSLWPHMGDVHIWQAALALCGRTWQQRGEGQQPGMWLRQGKLWGLCSPAELGKFLLGDGAWDLRKMVQPKERAPDLPTKGHVKDTSQTDSCRMTAESVDHRCFQNTFFFFIHFNILFLVLVISADCGENNMKNSSKSYFINASARDFIPSTTSYWVNSKFTFICNPQL